MSKLSAGEIAAVFSIAWGTEYYGSLATNRHVQLRVVRKLIKKGLAKSIGMVLLCDDDGFCLVPERYREGYVLTEEGIEMLRVMESNQ